MTDNDKALVKRLLTCPFCGGEPKVFHHQNKWVGETWHIECLDDNCGCGTCHHESADIAATVWNRRIVVQRHREQAAAEERAKIVEWLENEQRRYACTEYSMFASIIAEEIIGEEHLK